MHYQRGLGRMTVGVSALALAVVLGAVPAQAQQAPAPAPEEQAAPEGEPIVVTGSRIASAFNAPTPLTAVGADRLEQRAVANNGDALARIRT